MLLQNQSNILLEWNKKRHLPSYLKLQNMQDGVTNLGRYMNLHLEIGTAPIHFLTMDTIKVRDADSAYKYTFTLTNNHVDELHICDTSKRHLWKNISAQIHIQSVLTI